MAIPPAHTARPGARTADPGLLLIALGAILLLVSLFLEWFEPGIEAWDVFEVWDLVLAALAIAALVAVAGRMGYGPPRPSSWLVVAAAVAFVVVVAALLDHPPAADGPGNDPSTGLWLALVASILMLAGTLLSVARISVALDAGSHRHDHLRDNPIASPASPAAPVARTPPVDPIDPAGPTGPTRRL